MDPEACLKQITAFLDDARGIRERDEGRAAETESLYAAMDAALCLLIWLANRGNRPDMLLSARCHKLRETLP
jgi:hypothetical protein